MLDGYGRNINYLRLSVTDRCNLRCKYCMPADGVCKKRPEELLTEDETITAVRAAASVGITKLRITGGEPLLKKNILSLCRRAAAVEGIKEVCITTNGLLLPALAKPLREAGVRRVNLSIDTLDAEKYRGITRGGKLEDALRGLHAALEAGFERVKLNTVLVGGFNDGEIAALAGLTKEYPIDVRFIELMPMPGGEVFGENAYISCDAVLQALPELRPNGASGVAQLFRLPDALGDVGLIRPVSAQFCASCSRLRLTADGKLKACLHSPDERALKGLSQEEMAEQMRLCIAHKPACHAALSAQSRSQAGRGMYQIGG